MKVKNADIIDRIIDIDCHLCTNCGRCYNVCDKKAISRVTNYSCARCVKYCTTMDVPCKPERFVCDPDICDLCGKCIEVCPVSAIRIVEIK
ncbi:MAG: 4Fe-4S binding protein [Bacteroidales bacterium]|jgi:ferredoxin|nr:4Fe-4S binding protein [Bacteroidales bacterium]